MPHLNNYFDFHVCLSFRLLLRVSVRVSENYLQFLQTYDKMSLIKVVWYVLRVKNMHPGSPSGPSALQWDRCCRGEAEVRILNFKTTWSEFQMPSQTAPAEAKPRCIYSILKPHGQSFITSPESVQSSCVHQHTQDVPAKQILPCNQIKSSKY